MSSQSLLTFTVSKSKKNKSNNCKKKREMFYLY